MVPPGLILELHERQSDVIYSKTHKIFLEINYIYKELQIILFTKQNLEKHLLLSHKLLNFSNENKLFLLLFKSERPLGHRYLIKKIT